jgi:hypothetical protein
MLSFLVQSFLEEESEASAKSGKSACGKKKQSAAGSNGG